MSDESIAQEFGRKLVIGDELPVQEVRFYDQPVLNRVESERLGRPIYDDVPYVYIRYKDQVQSKSQRVEEKHKQRFPQQWEKFVRSKAGDASKTELSMLPAATPAIVAELQGMGAESVEQVAMLPLDGRLDAVIGQAQMYLKLRANNESHSGKRPIESGSIQQLCGVQGGHARKPQEVELLGSTNSGTGEGNFDFSASFVH